MTIKEEHEIRLIEEGLSFDSDSNRWVAKYPWIKNPKELPYNNLSPIKF